METLKKFFSHTAIQILAAATIIPVAIVVVISLYYKISLLAIKILFACNATNIVSCSWQGLMAGVSTVLFVGITISAIVYIFEEGLV